MVIPSDFEQIYQRIYNDWIAGDWGALLFLPCNSYICFWLPGNPTRICIFMNESKVSNYSGIVALAVFKAPPALAKTWPGVEITTVNFHSI